MIKVLDPAPQIEPYLCWQYFQRKWMIFERIPFEKYPPSQDVQHPKASKTNALPATLTSVTPCFMSFHHCTCHCSLRSLSSTTAPSKPLLVRANTIQHETKNGSVWFDNTLDIQHIEYAECQGCAFLSWICLYRFRGKKHWCFLTTNTSSIQLLWRSLNAPRPWCWSQSGGSTLFCCGQSSGIRSILDTVYTCLSIIWQDAELDSGGWLFLFLLIFFVLFALPWKEPHGPFPSISKQTRQQNPVYQENVHTKVAANQVGGSPKLSDTPVHSCFGIIPVK